jgi:hypothetical protein
MTVPRFSVLLTRDVTESAKVEIDAANRDEAERLALECDTVALVWHVDDGHEWGLPYVTAVDELDQSLSRSCTHDH